MPALCIPHVAHQCGRAGNGIDRDEFTREIIRGLADSVQNAGGRMLRDPEESAKLILGNATVRIYDERGWIEREIPPPVDAQLLYAPRAQNTRP